MVRDLLGEVREASRSAPDLDALTVEHGKSAADLITAYRQADGDEATAQVARGSAGTLSPAYIAARRRDLGGNP